MLSMSQRAPGYRLNNHVPPTLSARSMITALQPELSQPMQRIQAGEPGTDDDRVEATF